MSSVGIIKDKTLEIKAIESVRTTLSEIRQPDRESRNVPLPLKALTLAEDFSGYYL